jgi:hypothetical protein
MADISFDKSKGTLTAFGRTWPAVSGIKGKHKPLPAGTYTAPAGALMTGTEQVLGVGFNTKYGHPAYKDRTGFGWFMWLGKGNLGIHPDGNVPGTQGCIGVTKNNTRDLFELLRSRNGEAISVIVK